MVHPKAIQYTHLGRTYRIVVVGELVEITQHPKGIKKTYQHKQYPVKPEGKRMWDLDAVESLINDYIIECLV